MLQPNQYPSNVAVWLTRHPYPAALPGQLGGMKLLHVGERYASADAALWGALHAAGCQPAVIFFILPMRWREAFVRRAQALTPGTALVRCWLTQTGDVIYQRYTLLADGRLRWHAWQPWEVAR